VIGILNRVLTRIVERIWPEPPAWKTGRYHEKSCEIVFFVGFMFMLMGAFHLNALTTAFGAGLMAGGLLNHRLEQNREKGWSYR
jgi:hypothetical protein